MTGTPESTPTRARTAPISELKLLRFRESFARTLASLAEPTDQRRLWKVGLRTLVDFFGAGLGRIVFLDLATGKEEVYRAATNGAPLVEPVDVAICRAWVQRLRGRARIPAGCLVGRLLQDSRVQGMLVLEREAPYARRLREPFRACLALLQAEAQRRQDRRLAELKERLSEKLVRKLPPKDFFYQLFHGLRSLIRYDHSAALLVTRGMGSSLELVAEQLAWKKGKSEAVGSTVPLSSALRELLMESPQAFMLEDLQVAGAEPHPALCGLMPSGNGLDQPPVRSLIVAPLRYRRSLVGVLRIAGRHAPSLGSDHAARLHSLLPIAAAALGNQLVDQQATDHMLALDREKGMGELARGVAHDVNNALGALIPLLEQCRADLAASASPGSVLADDLRESERYARYCKKIFAGMLRFARRGLAHPEPVVVNSTVEEALELLTDDLRGRGIDLVKDLALDLPQVLLGPNALDHIVVNLMHNARDATPRGGRITVSTRAIEDGIEVCVADTGSGIAPEDLAQLPQPFFSTKPGGNGLGLALVRAIAWDHDGDLRIESELDEGTVVRVRLTSQRRPL
ncbi:MAG: ATP-binding protein [Planctomycetota bacterium]